MTPSLRPKAALAEGIVAGGGVTLVNLSDGLHLQGLTPVDAGRTYCQTGPYCKPFRQLMVNAASPLKPLLAQVQGAKSARHQRQRNQAN